MLRSIATKIVESLAIRRRLKMAFHSWIVKEPLKRLPLVRKLYHVTEQRDRFDKEYGIDTSGVEPVELIHPDKSLTALIRPYLGSRPNTVRQAFDALGNLTEYTLVDLGCGKGRVAVIGTEFSFQKIIGIELSGKLVRAARRNARILERNHPGRPHIEIHQENAVESQFPKGKIVIFLYHSFGRELFAQLMTKLEQWLATDGQHLFFVYNNPVCGDILDASPRFSRWYAERIPYDPSDLDYQPGGKDNIVIWQSVAHALATPYANAGRKIIVADPVWGAHLED